MNRKYNPEKIKPPVSAVEQQMIERRVKQASAATKPAPKLAKPKRIDRDKETYFRAEFYCPVCDDFLASYTYGRKWTANGLHDDKRVDCHNCGQMIDWTGVPAED